MRLEQLVDDIKVKFIGNNNWLLSKKFQKNIPQNPYMIPSSEYKAVISIITDDFEIIRIITNDTSTHVHIEMVKTIFRGDSSDLSIKSASFYTSLYYGDISCKENKDEIDIDFLLSVLQRRNAIGKENTHN
ncbi:MAG: hypothetical protein NT153_05260 [Bacteroidetes bacterium]|nr:hypothetical protein [Bacteroidota bacterium]